MATRSEAEALATCPQEVQNEFFDSLTEKEAEELMYSWEFFSRPEQRAPEGDWKTWLILAGRGFGKTRAGSEFIRQMVCGPTPEAPGKCRRIALIGETAKDTRDVMVEGDSGIMGVHPPAFRPLYEPSKARLTWPNGAEATLYNATEPDQLRGPQFDLAWLDELAKWRYADETWDMLQFGLRLGAHPRQIITTTPRPIPLVKALIKAAEEGRPVVVTKGSTYDNLANLAPSFIEEIKNKYEGTRLGQQELHADVLLDMPGALWKSDMLDRNRCQMSEVPDLERVVVAIDPAMNTTIEATDDTSETGIVVAGRGTDGLGYILDDATCVEMPEGWARKAIAAYDMYEGDRIVAEINQGGAMVEHTVRAVRDVPFTPVRASRGKVTRAEPISALYEQNRVKHVGKFNALEDQMLQFTRASEPGKSDRVDALVWALTALFPSTVLRTRNSDFDEDGYDTNEFGFY